jgi:hypothetical protein
MYSLAAALRDGRDGAVSMTHAPIFFAVAEQRPGAFEPSYEWQEVAQGQSVASGLDVRCHAMLPAPLLPAPLPHASPPAAVRLPSCSRAPPRGCARHAMLRCCGAGAPVARRLAQDPRAHPAHVAAAGAVQLRAGGRAGGRAGWRMGVRGGLPVTNQRLTSALPARSH